MGKTFWTYRTKLQPCMEITWYNNYPDPDIYKPDHLIFLTLPTVPLKIYPSLDTPYFYRS